MARAMHKVRNVVAAVDIRGLEEGQTTDIHTCCYKILQLCDKYSRTPTTCAFSFFDSTVCPDEARLRAEEALGKSTTYSRFTSPNQMYDPLALALDELTSELPVSANAEEAAVDAGTAIGFLREGLLAMVDRFSWHDKAVEEGREKKTWETEPNLLVLFTPWLHLSSLSLNMSKVDIMNSLVRELRGVGKILVNRGIHLCWVNVEQLSRVSSSESQTMVVGGGNSSEVASEQLTMRSSFAQLKWSFWNLEFLISSSASLPFSLIWPSIAFPALRLPCRETFTSADVVLEVEDCGMAKMEPLSHVELYDLTFLQPGSKPSSRKKRCLVGRGNKRIPGEAAATVTVTKVLPKHTALPAWLCECDTFLMWTCSKTESLQNGMHYEHPDGHIFRLSQQDQCECDLSRLSWQVFLLQLARARVAAVVHFSQYGSTYAALLEPLTVHCATLSIVTTKESSLLTTMSSSSRLTRLSSQYGQSHVGLKRPTCQLEAAVELDPPDGEKEVDQEEHAAMWNQTGDIVMTSESENPSSRIGETSSEDQRAGDVDPAVKRNETEQEEAGLRDETGNLLITEEVPNQAPVGEQGTEVQDTLVVDVAKDVEGQEEQAGLRDERKNPLITEEVASRLTTGESCTESQGKVSEDLARSLKAAELQEEQAGQRKEDRQPLVTGEAGNPSMAGGYTDDQLMNLVEAALHYVDGEISQHKVPDSDVPPNNESTDILMGDKEGEQAQSTEPDFEVPHKGLSSPVLVAVEQQTDHLGVETVGTTEAQGYCASGQTEGPRNITAPDIGKVTWQATGLLSNSGALVETGAGTSKDSVTRLEMEIMTQLQSLVSKGIFSDQEIIRLGVEICHLIELLFLPSRRGVPKVRQDHLQVFFQRYLDPFPVVFAKVCEILEDKGWIMTRVKRQSVRDRIRRQELKGPCTRDTCVQIRRKRTNIDETVEDAVDDPEEADDMETSHMATGKKQRVIAPQLLRLINPRLSCTLPKLMIDETRDFAVFDFTEED